MQIYNELIVGSGPCAYSYLLAKKKLNNSVLVTSDETNVVNKTIINVHPKLKKNGVSLVSEKIDDCYITSSYGGLSNAWGGTLVRALGNELEFFYHDSYDYEQWDKAYSLLIDDISNFKNIHKVEKTASDSRDIFTIIPHNQFGWESGELSLTPCIDNQLSRLGLEIKSGFEVKNITRINDKLHVVSSNDEVLVANKVVLAAGVVSNQVLLGDAVDVVDHVPLQILTLSKKNKNSNFSPVSKYCLSENGISIYYDLRQLSQDFLKTEAGFLGAYIIMFLSKILNVSVVQCWDNNSYSKSPGSRLFLNDIVSKFWGCLKKRHLPFFFRATKYGDGFHYVDGNANKDYKLLNDKGLTVLGGNRIKQIPFFNPTLTYMAHSYLEGLADD